MISDKEKSKSALDELFIDAFKILDQEKHEDRFRGKVLSNFAKIEQILLMIIKYHDSKTSKKNKKFKKNQILSINWKINELEKILSEKIYQNNSFDFKDTISKIKECKELRNQLAHNIVYPGSTSESAKEGKKKITMLFLDDKQWKKQELSTEQQEELENKVYSTYRQVREMYRVIVESHGDLSLLAI